MTGRVLFLAQILEVDEINPENFMDLFPRRHPPLMFVPRALMGNFLFHRIMGIFLMRSCKIFCFYHTAGCVWRCDQSEVTW